MQRLSAAVMRLDRNRKPGMNWTCLQVELQFSSRARSASGRCFYVFCGKSERESGSSTQGHPTSIFRKSVYSEDDLRSRIFGTFVVKSLTYLPLLGFSNIKGHLGLSKAFFLAKMF